MLPATKPTKPTTLCEVTENGSCQPCSLLVHVQGENKQRLSQRTVTAPTFVEVALVIVITVELSLPLVVIVIVIVVVEVIVISANVI